MCENPAPPEILVLLIGSHVDRIGVGARWSGWSTQYAVSTNSRCYYAVRTSGTGGNFTFLAEIETPCVNSLY